MISGWVQNVTEHRETIEYVKCKKVFTGEIKVDVVEHRAQSCSNERSAKKSGK